MSYGVVAAGRRWFVKGATGDRGGRSLARARALHGAVRHPAIVPLLGHFRAAGLPVVVMPWTEGEVLYHPAEPSRGATARTRFLELPRDARLEAARTIVDAHVAVAAGGFVAVDLYDGCFLYDFERSAMRLVDLDEYRRGPFVVQADRLPGSTRYMAPEEWVRGARIDERTTVFALGRTLQQLVPDAPDAIASVAGRATAADPSRRWPSVSDLAGALGL